MDFEVKTCEEIRRNATTAINVVDARKTIKESCTVIKQLLCVVNNQITSEYSKPEPDYAFIKGLNEIVNNSITYLELNTHF